MVDKQTLVEAIRDDLENQVVGSVTVPYSSGDETVTIESDDVTKLNPARIEDPPQVLYDYNDIPRGVNGVGGGQVHATYNNDGSIDEYVFRRYRTLLTTVVVTGSDEVEKEAVKRLISDRYEPYNFIIRGPNPSDLHSGVSDIRFGDDSSDDIPEEEYPIRVSSLTIEVDFHRDYTLTDENISRFGIEVDADLDSGTTGETYTSN